MVEKGKAVSNKDNKRNSLLFYTDCWIKAGVERVLSVLLPELAQYYHVYLVTNKSTTKTGFYLPENVVHLVIEDSEKTNLPKRLLEIVQLYHIDLFIGNCNLNVYMYRIYDNLVQHNIKVIALNHECFFAPCYTLSKVEIVKLRKEIYGKLDANLWLTSHSAFLAQKNYGNAYVMPNPNVYASNVKLENKPNNKIILCVGRFKDKNKRVDRALKVFQKVAEYEPNAKLFLIGTYDKNVKIFPGRKSIKDILVETNLEKSKSVFWLDEQCDMKKYYEQASVIISVSENEGFPMSLTEAAQYGCPGIAFNIYGLEDIIIDGENGYLIPQDEIDNMAFHLIGLLRDNKKLLKMQKKAQIYVERFNVHIVINEWRTLIKTILFDQKYYGYFDKIYGRNKEIQEGQARQDYIQVIRGLRKKIGQEKQMVGVDANDNNIDLSLLLENELLQAEEFIKTKLQLLPLQNSQKTIGIYGMGTHTENLLERYERLIGKIVASVVFIDSTKKTGGYYKGHKVYNVHDIPQSGIDEIIISTFLYEDEIYKNLIQLFGSRYKIHRFYDCCEEKIF